METHKLDGGHILLPPEVFLETRSCSRESIVEVHDNMHSCINHGVKGAHSPSWKKRKKHCYSKTKSFLFCGLSVLLSFCKQTKVIILNPYQESR